VCHRQENICIVATLADGLAVIDQTHEVTYLTGTSSSTWIGVDCADPTLNECVGFASGLKTQAIRLDIISPGKSTTENLMQFGTLNGDFTSVKFWPKTQRLGIQWLQAEALLLFGKQTNVRDSSLHPSATSFRFPPKHPSRLTTV